MDLDEETAYNQDIKPSEAQIRAGPSTHAGPSSSGEQGDTPMSKKAMKRAARLARIQELKPIKRAQEKARRREKLHQLKASEAAGTLTPEQQKFIEDRKAWDKKRKVAKRHAAAGAQDWGGGIIIDLGFDELMTDQEITSMASQLGYVYSANRTAKQPFSTILHTSFSPTMSPRLWEKMSKTAFERWTRSYWWSQGLEDVSKALEAAEISASLEPSRDFTAVPPTEASSTPIIGRDLEAVLTGPRLPPKLSGKHKLVYLSADAEDELSTLAEDEVYIIGGIVDRNRYKNLCQEKAEKLGIRTARLPIGSYIANLPTRKVLTVNQVLEILAEYLARNDWREAFHTVIPLRKYVPGKKQRNHRIDGTESVEADGDGGENDGEDPEANDVDLDPAGESVGQAPGA